VNDLERVKLLFGPYNPPPLKRGDRAFCLYRDQLVVVTWWSDARIPWPRCRPPGNRGGTCGLLVDDTLVRAIQHESATALGYWWGVSCATVERWRRTFGVGRTDPEGSQRLIRSAIQASLSARFGDDHDRLWTPEEMALLGVLPDGEVALRTGRTTNAVALTRERLGRANVNARPDAFTGRPWTAAEDNAVCTLPPKEAAARTGRSMQAVYIRRRDLGVAAQMSRRTTS